MKIRQYLFFSKKIITIIGINDQKIINNRFYALNFNIKK